MSSLQKVMPLYRSNTHKAFIFCCSFLRSFDCVTDSTSIPSQQKPQSKCKNMQKSNVDQFFHKKNLFLKILQTFTKKHQCWSLILIKLRLLQACFSKKRLQHLCFPVNIAEFLRTSILKSIYGRLLLRSVFITLSRSSHQRCSVKKRVLRNFSKSTGKHLCQGLLFNKVAGLMFAVKKLKYKTISGN